MNNQLKRFRLQKQKQLMRIPQSVVTPQGDLVDEATAATEGEGEAGNSLILLLSYNNP